LRFLKVSFLYRTLIFVQLFVLNSLFSENLSFLIYLKGIFVRIIIKSLLEFNFTHRKINSSKTNLIVN